MMRNYTLKKKVLFSIVGILFSVFIAGVIGVIGFRIYGSDENGAQDTDTVTIASNENKAPDRPNIVVIFTDDQRWDTIGDTGVNAEIKQQFGRPVMPNVEKRLVENGVIFTNSFVTTPVCCPDRASTLSGGFYAHNTGVLINKLPNGGAQKFRDTETLATLLQKAGYETALIGKYMNGYTPMAPYVPPGWTKFVVQTGQNAVLGSSGSTSSTGVIKTQTQYRTDFERDQSLQFLDEYGNSPFLLFLSTNAPHYPATPALGDEDLFPDYAWRGGAYGEDDLSDKPNITRQKARQFEGLVGVWLDEFQRNQLRSLQAVDRAVGAIVDKIDAMGKLDQTVFIFTSDNGFMWGEHRQFGKGQPFEESIRVPFVIRMPGIAPRTDARLVVANLDIGTTIFDLAGVQKETDGESLVPILENPGALWRDEFLIEMFQADNNFFAGLRGEKWKYLERPSGEKELYDLVNDPYEEESKHNDPDNKRIMREFHDRLEPQKGLAITTLKAPEAEPNRYYQFQLTAWGSEKPYTWSIVAGELPQGLSLNSASGLISGVQVNAKQKKVSIKVEGSSIAKQAGEFQSFIQEFTFGATP